MKTSILIVAGLAVAAGAVVYVALRPNKTSPAPAQPAGLAAEEQQVAAGAGHAKAPEKEKKEASQTTASRTDGSETNSMAENIAFAADIAVLVSPHSSYAEKQRAWKELLDAGRIREAIAELEQRAAGNPQDAEIAATLGQAYLKACATTQDVREQAIWAMEGDQEFDAALKIDPLNWEARFTKAVAMSYWPANLNKGQEVIDQFNTLIQQQEGEAPQPQFAQTYDWLGQQYAKSGQADLAQQTWQRGASLFPESLALQGRLAAPQTPRQ